MSKLKRSDFRPARERIEADAHEMANVVRSDRTKDRETGAVDPQTDGLD